MVLRLSSMFFFFFFCSYHWMATGCGGCWVAVIRERLNAQCSSGWLMIRPLNRYSAAENTAWGNKNLAEIHKMTLSFHCHISRCKSQTHKAKKQTHLLLSQNETIYCVVNVLYRNACFFILSYTDCISHLCAWFTGCFWLSGVKWRASQTQTKTGNHNTFVSASVLCVCVWLFTYKHVLCAPL